MAKFVCRLKAGLGRHGGIAVAVRSNPRAEAHFQVHFRLMQLVAGDLARETSQQCLDVLCFVSWASRRVNIEFSNGLPIACPRFVSVEIRA